MTYTYLPTYLTPNTKVHSGPSKVQGGGWVKPARRGKQIKGCSPLLKDPADDDEVR